MFEQESISESLPQQAEAGTADKRQPVSLPDRCLHQVFEAQAEQHPHAIALSFGEERLTYSELNVRANQLAHYLQTLGVGPEVLVGLHVERSIDAIVGMLGILKAGGAYVPLDPAYPQDRLAYMLQDAQVPVLITGSERKPELAQPQVKVVLLAAEREKIGHQPGDNPDSAVSPDNLMYVIYTSGSTGKPKGIMVTHRNVARLFPATQSYLSFDKNDVWALFHSYSFGFSVWEIWGALWHGAKLVIVPPEISQSPDDFYQLVCRERITVLSQTPSAFSLFLLADGAAKQRADLSLRYIVFSGERLEPTLLESWMARHGDKQPQLINMYAITETAGEITYQRLLARNLTQATRSVIGVPLPDVRIYILDEEGQPVPKGELGEMYVGSSAVARGYLNLPKLTAQKFLRNPFSDQKQARLYKTGDRARYLPNGANGEIEFLGRVDDQVKIRGYRVELSEIQAVLATHPAIHEAVVVAPSSPHGQHRLVAYFVPRKPSGMAAGNGHDPLLTTAELQSFLKTNLPEYMIPGTFVKLDMLPRSPNGKIDRHWLPPDREPLESMPRYKAQTAAEEALADLWALDAEPATPVMPVAEVLAPGAALKTNYVEPHTSVEKTVAQIWKEVLGLSKVSLHDDFLELGGNSLLVAQALYRTNDEFKVNLSMRQFFDAGTVAGLALLITQNQAEQVETEELADILASLAEFSEEEAQQLLTAQTDPTVQATRLPATQSAAEEMRQHETYMRLAISKARQAIRENQTPVAACLVKDGQVVACVHNAVRQNVDITAHAEVQVIREACRQLNTTDLSGCVLYSTLEPCPMCFSACHWAKLTKVVYGARRDDAEKVDLHNTRMPVHTLKELLHSPTELVEGILRKDILQVLELWFEARGTQSPQYDKIAEQFQQIRNSPINKHITDHTFFAMVGALDREKSVLDLACGEGHYSRMLKRRGAARVVGVDISSQMIKLAEQRETGEPLGIDYLCRDVLELGKIGEFDLVVASLLLNHARTKKQLVNMCRTAFENLKPGGRFILINENFNQSPRDFQGYERYGYAKTMVEPYHEGAVITYTLSTGAEEFRFEGNYWSEATYQTAFRTAGFTDVQLRNLSCSPQGIEEYGRRFWQNFINNPPFIGIICRKSEIRKSEIRKA